MRSRHQRTLERIFARPTPSDIRWADVISLMRALDVEISERAGSRVLFRQGPTRVVVDRPHEPNLDQAAVRTIAGFLDRLGVTS
ncbi:MAG: hexulose-6-phosphate isomerase [Chloroflexi bacterium]|nr:hexulose-6-phosphate isomerase [Chloroflexota bacterium]